MVGNLISSKQTSPFCNACRKDVDELICSAHQACGEAWLVITSSGLRFSKEQATQNQGQIRNFETLVWYLPKWFGETTHFWLETLAGVSMAQRIWRHNTKVAIASLKMLNKTIYIIVSANTELRWDWHHFYSLRMGTISWSPMVLQVKPALEERCDHILPCPPWRVKAMRYFAFNEKNGLVGLLKDYRGYCLAIKYVLIFLFLNLGKSWFFQGKRFIEKRCTFNVLPVCSRNHGGLLSLSNQKKFRSGPMRSLLLDHRSLRQGLLDRRYAEKETRKTSAASDFDRAGGLMGVYDICNWWSPVLLLLLYPSKMRIKMKFRWTRVVAAKNNTFDFWRF